MALTSATAPGCSIVCLDRSGTGQGSIRLPLGLPHGPGAHMVTVPAARYVDLNYVPPDGSVDPGDGISINQILAGLPSSTWPPCTPLSTARCDETSGPRE